MAFQLLKGVQVTPRGNYNLGRFSKSLVNGAWPNSFAFNGWIYQATTDIGFSNQASEIRLSIVLEVSDRDQKYAFFDIKDEDLKCGAGNGGDENWFDIDFNGVKFSNFYLYSKEIGIENGEKILNVTFKDYSIILDKIYIGLLKRQGKEFVRDANATISFAVLCPDCLLQGDSVTQVGYANRDISFGSYVGINGKTYDNFANVDSSMNIYPQWESLFTQPAKKPFFDLNGGYLIIGTEEATEEKCGGLAPVSYNFNQLLASLRMRGLNFTGTFPTSIKDADFIYHQNYIGTLREVLQQWCSDLGYDFYCSGKTFIGINLNKSLDISKVVQIADPTTELGSEFSLNKNSAIISYKSSTTLTNTFKQSVITTNSRPLEYKTHSKSPKRYVGYLPMHPIDLNRRSNDRVMRYNAFGSWYYDIAWGNNFNPGSNDRNKTLPELDGRTFGDIDTSIALSKYDSTLRDLFCQDRALYGETLEIRAANFRALGMVPLVELTDESKAMAIENAIPENGDSISNICRDKRFYKVYIGYYYPKFKDDITSWEQSAAEAMYKHGILLKGLLTSYPYFPQDSLTDISPKAGFYGENGVSILRTQHSIEPAANQYYSLKMSPFKDLVLYSGLMSPVKEKLPIDLNNTGLFPEGLFYTTLNNEWGTTQEDFKRKMSFSLDDPCIQEYATQESYTQIVNNIPKKYQDWRLEIFRPHVTPDLEKFDVEAQLALQNLPVQTSYDKTVNIYYDHNFKLAESCSKLHIFVLTDTRTHPNVYLEFNPLGTEFVNPIMLQQYIDRLRDSEKRRVNTRTPSECDVTLLQEMCKNLMLNNFTTLADPRFGCIQDEDKFNWFEDGFTYKYLTMPNSRALNIKVVKNPIRTSNTNALTSMFAEADVNGDFYFADVTSNLLTYNSSEVSMNIVYPISMNSVGGPDGNYYRGVLTSNIEMENRSPEIVEIYGEPVNSINNNTSTIKVLNNSVDPDLQPQLDPYSSRFFSYLTVITGDSSVVTTISQYHELIKRLNFNELTNPMKTVDLVIAGAPSDMGNFSGYLSPDYGLNKMSLSVGSQGVTTSLSYADRAKVLPKAESVLNKINVRIK